MNKNKCIYCDNTIENEDEKHFISDCCGRGMCEDCYNGDIGTEEQLGLDWYDEIFRIKPKYRNATYLCFEDCCAKKWQMKDSDIIDELVDENKIIDSALDHYAEVLAYFVDRFEESDKESNAMWVEAKQLLTNE